jgi:hypothetical protein
MFKSNVGSVDRVLRIIVGIAALALFFVYPEASWRNWTLIGIVPLMTGLFSTCPAYTIFGLSTCPIKRA